MNLLNFALELHKKGISFVPLKIGTKNKYLVKWTEYQHRLPTLDEVNQWFKDSDKNIAIITGAASGLVVVDPDTEEALDWVRKHLPDTPMKTKTLNGEHLFYRYPKDSEKIKTFSKYKNENLYLDLDVRGDGGCVIAPGSIHPEGHVYREIQPWSDVELESLPVFDPNWLPQRTISQSSKVVSMPALNRKILNELKAKGQAIEGDAGDAHTFAVACYLMRDLGLSHDEAMSYFSDWNKLNQPPWTEAELKKKLLGAIAYGSGSLAKKRNLILTSAKNLLAEPPENFDWLWHDRLISIGTSIIVSKPKIGKTTFARNLAASIVSGSAFLGMATKKSPVVYIAAEENREQFKKSLSHFNPETIKDLYVHTGHTPPDLIECLEQYMEQIKPSLIILDTMIRAINVSDTNSYAEMTKALAPFQDLATRYQCHIMFLHHAGKMEREHGDGVLGSTAIFGSVDSLLMLEKRKDQIYVRSIQRYGDSLEPHLLSYDKESRAHSLGSSSEEIQRSSHEDKVLSFLTARPNSTESDIHSNVEGHKATIGLTIRRLTSEGKLIRKGQGKRNDPFLYSLTF